VAARARRRGPGAGTVRVGTSGWSYQHWEGLVYPAGSDSREWLGHYARLLDSVEINASFYHLPREPALAAWVEHTPRRFVFALKAWRRITHYRRLIDCQELLDVFLARARRLGPKLGPILFQLPGRFRVDAARLAAFLNLLPTDLRFAVEFRDPSWHVEEIYATLARRNVAFCVFELAALVSPRMATADFIYVRLHGRAARYRGSYSEAALREWAQWLRAHLADGRDVFVYFDNTDLRDYAVRNAKRLGVLLRA
jgi:uncharacterized protein YecE (DUF72 family)